MIMKERPILFQGAMVRALLDGSKTQTRRIITGPKHGLKVNAHPTEPAIIATRVDEQWDGFVFSGGMCRVGPVQCPYGQPGDQLWVRETWGVGSRPDPWGGYDGIEYRADEAWLEEGDDLPCYKVATPDDICLGDYRSGWKPSIHMPRWASRIQLEITGVRVERLQDICEADARAEGITDGGCVNCGDPEPCGCPNPSPDARDAYVSLWESINGAGSWGANPWVWVVEFKQVLP